MRRYGSLINIKPYGCMMEDEKAAGLLSKVKKEKKVAHFLPNKEWYHESWESFLTGEILCPDRFKVLSCVFTVQFFFRLNVQRCTLLIEPDRTVKKIWLKPHITVKPHKTLNRENNR